MPDVSPYTVNQAAQFSGQTLVMVNYLCRTGVLEPSGNGPRGRGKRREYSFTDIVMLKSLKRLLDSGVSVANLKTALDELRRKYPQIDSKRLPANLRYLVTDGEKIYFRNKTQALEALDKTGQFAFAFVINVEQVRGEVVHAIAAQGGQK